MFKHINFGAVPYVLILQLALGASLVNARGTSEKAETFSPYVDAKGQISLPTDFRRNMVHLGSWYVPEGEASGFHDVYADAKAVDEYRRTGKFPDGAAIVKELRNATAGQYTTGANVSYANNKIKQWFVMVKDANGRFPKDTRWGDGWGWALIKPDDVAKNISKNYKSDCIGCHIPAQNNDWIYVEGYPTLFSSKK